MDDHIERYQFCQFQQGKQGLPHPYSGYLYEPVKVLHKLYQPRDLFRQQSNDTELLIPQINEILKPLHYPVLRMDS